MSVVKAPAASSAGAAKRATIADIDRTLRRYCLALRTAPPENKIILWARIDRWLDARLELMRSA